MQIPHAGYRSHEAAASHLTTAPNAYQPEVLDQSPLRDAHTPALYPLGSTASRHCAAINAVVAHPTKEVLMSAENSHQAYVPLVGAHRLVGAHADNAPPPPPPANDRNHPAIGAIGQTLGLPWAAARVATANWTIFRHRKNTLRHVQLRNTGASALLKK
ncbi:hypothetical protein [Photobacterium carnosum]|uniref:hypothetical protein n=1 Tax=Photobacterium carnosum TaxID=2023717 RepID=UPI001D13A12B|nr:hypothetical protein [Photobacterium carnosum]